MLALEVSRTLLDAKWFKWMAVSATVAGLFAHIVYLTLQKELVLNQSGLLLSGWTGWFLVASVFVMAAYLWLLISKGNSVVSLFLVPLALLAIAIGNWPGQNNSFPVRETRTIWNTIHGLSFLLSTVIVGLGFLFGMLYLVQARRLKTGQVLKIRMPSLEWLQNSGEKTLWSSASLLTIGVISGIAINIINRFQGIMVIAWHDPVVWTSAVLLAWLLIIIVFNWFYKPNRQGRKVSYWVMACFLFLVLEIGLVLYSGHASDFADQTGKVEQTNEVQI